jgi:agmatine deiminase
MTTPLPMPAEFSEQEWIWIGFPHDASLWEESLVPAQEQIAAYANAVAETGQQVRLVVHDAVNEARARELVSASVMLERHPYGDIWLRDTGPLVLLDGTGRRYARKFRFNGWGGKYDDMEGDQEIGASMAEAGGLPLEQSHWVLEGGAIETDGSGLVVTTEQCLLNPNRNPDLSRANIEERLRLELGLRDVLWLGEGLACDHTDGHVDNLARFVAPGELAIPLATGPDDPNAAIYDDARARAGVRTDRSRRSLSRADRGSRSGRAGELHEFRHLQRHRRRTDVRHGARRRRRRRDRRAVSGPRDDRLARRCRAHRRWQLPLRQPARAQARPLGLR